MMVVLELDQVEIDHCFECGGIWLDSGELELLLEGKDETDEHLSSFIVDKNCKEEKIKCPICNKKMDKILYGNHNGKDVLVDKCKRNHGIWFDDGELEQIAKIVHTHHSKKVLNLLHDMFGHKLKSK
jgi:hypothetical protein